MLKKIMKKGKNNKGFTLVELLVVIAIIAILAVVAVPSLMKNINKAKVADIVADYSAIKAQVLATYADDSLAEGTYTKLMDNTTLVMPASGTPGQPGSTEKQELEVHDLSKEAKYTLVVGKDNTTKNQKATLTIEVKTPDIASKVSESINGTHTADSVAVTVEILK